MYFCGNVGSLVLIISLKLPNVLKSRLCQMCKKFGLTSFHILNAPVGEGGSRGDYIKVTIMLVARSDRQFVGSFFTFLAFT